MNNEDRNYTSLELYDEKDQELRYDEDGIDLDLALAQGFSQERRRRCLKRSAFLFAILIALTIVVWRPGTTRGNNKAQPSPSSSSQQDNPRQPAPAPRPAPSKPSKTTTPRPTSNIPSTTTSWNDTWHKIDLEIPYTNGTDAPDDWPTYRVALSDDGNRLAIGDELATVLDQEQAGRALLYTLDDNNRKYELARTFYEQPPKAFHYMGGTVGLSGNGRVMAVGIPAQLGDSVDSEGTVNIYRTDRNDWSAEYSIMPVHNLTLGDWTGVSVALTHNGSQCLVGSPLYNMTRGAVRVVDTMTGNETLLHGHGDGDEFGIHVAIAGSGTHMIVASHHDSQKNSYLYDHFNTDGLMEKEWVETESMSLTSSAFDCNSTEATVAMSNDGTIWATTALCKKTNRASATESLHWSRTVTSNGNFQTAEINRDGLGTATIPMMALSGDGQTLTLCVGGIVEVFQWQEGSWMPIGGPAARIDGGWKFVEQTYDGEEQDARQDDVTSIALSKDGSRLALATNGMDRVEGGSYVEVFDFQQS